MDESSNEAVFLYNKKMTLIRTLKKEFVTHSNYLIIIIFSFYLKNHTILKTTIIC